MPLDIEVGKKYLDEYGNSWTVIGRCQFYPHLFKAAKDNHPSMGPERFHDSGESFLPGVPNLVSEIPSPATTPQFKVGDKVRSTNKVCHPGRTGTVQQINDTGVKVGFDESDDFCWFSPKSLAYLTPDTQPTYVPTCTCETLLLMREGCRCGYARVAIEQEFKREGWR